MNQIIDNRHKADVVSAGIFALMEAMVPKILDDEQVPENIKVTLATYMRVAIKRYEQVSKRAPLGDREALVAMVEVLTGCLTMMEAKGAEDGVPLH